MALTKKYLMYISYIGSDFCGSQIQIFKEPYITRKTIQGVLESALQNLFKLEGNRPIRTSLVSRTDTGVHALKAAVFTTLPKYRNDFLKPNSLVELLNKHILESQTVRVLEAYTLPESVQNIKTKKDKTYLYRVGFLKQEVDIKYRNVPIFEINRTHFIWKQDRTFDLKKAQEAAYLFEGIKDFGAIIGRPSRNVLPTICNIMSFKVQESQPLFPLDPLCQRFHFYHFICRGDKFLNHMVRRMVSLVLAVGLSKISLKDIKKLFDEPLPSSWPNNVTQVPGFGLYLIDVNIDFCSVNEEEPDEKATDEVNLNAFNVKLIQ